MMPPTPRPAPTLATTREVRQYLFHVAYQDTPVDVAALLAFIYAPGREEAPMPPPPKGHPLTEWDAPR